MSEKKPVVVVKVGGSTFDVIVYGQLAGLTGDIFPSEMPNREWFLNLVKEKGKDLDPIPGIVEHLGKLAKDYEIVVTVGTGPVGDFLQIEKTPGQKYVFDASGADDETLRRAAALYTNTETLLHGAIEKSAHGFYLVPFPPPSSYIRITGKEIPITESDVATLAMAEAFGAERVVFVKNAPGVFDKDPRDFPGATKFERITADDLLKIPRGDHLVEDAALRFWIEKCKNVKEIHVVECFHPEELKEAFKGRLTVHSSIIYRIKELVPVEKQPPTKLR